MKTFFLAFFLALSLSLSYADTLAQAVHRHQVKYGINWTPFSGTVTVTCLPAANYMGDVYTANGSAGTVAVYVTEGTIECSLVAVNAQSQTSTVAITFDYPNPVVIRGPIAPDPPTGVLITKNIIFNVLRGFP